ncbi:MAG: NAD(P)-dependent oxidoreductase, partial [Anaerococcus sp.]
MNYLQNKLKEHGNICVGIVGLGIMGKSLLTTLNILEAFGPSIISARRKESLTEAFAIAKIPEDRYILTNDIDKARIAIK